MASWLPPLAWYSLLSTQQCNLINYKKEYVLSAWYLQQLFILLRTLWPSRLYKIWSSTNLSDCIFCPTFLLKVLPQSFWSPVCWKCQAHFHLTSALAHSLPVKCSPEIVVSLFTIFAFSPPHSIYQHWTYSITHCLSSPTRIQALWYQKLLFVHCYILVPRPVPDTW